MMALRDKRAQKLSLIKVVLAVACAISTALQSPSSKGDEKAQRAATELFEKHVRPTLIEHCIRCHGEAKQKGGLRLDSAMGLVQGGDSGTAVIPRDDQSLLLRAIRYDEVGFEMPPRGRLPDRTIEAFESWVSLGAIDPRESNAGDGDPLDSIPRDEEDGRDPSNRSSVQEDGSWAFQPITKQEIPAVENRTWPASTIDQFVLAGMERIGVSPNPAADRATLLRRVTYDLTGLPPTPDELDQFLRDASPNAYAKVIDRLLHSDRFGQRWGRHWLDVVRFAESSGGGRTLLIPEAWRYRDYVIECFNSDTSYDRFVKQQVAGDLLPSESWQERQRNLIATGFLLLGPTNYELQDKDILELDVVDEQLDTLGKAFLGMTIGCARCHDHKFDPIPTSDYYAMAGILQSTQSLIHSNVSKWNTVELPVAKAEEARLAAHREVVTDAKRKLSQATRRWKLAGGDPKSKQTSIDADKIDAVVLDDHDAILQGQWTESTAIAGYVGEHYLHDASQDRGEKSATFEHSPESGGDYHVLISYTPGPNRATRVPVRITHADGETCVHVNQQKAPEVGKAFVSVGRYRVDANRPLRVSLSNEGTNDGVVIVDSVLIVAADRDLGEVFAYQNRKPSKDQKPSADRGQIETLKAEVDQLGRMLKRLETSGPKRPVAISVQESPNTRDIHLAIRGVAGQHGPVVPRGAMQSASWQEFPTIEQGCSGRRELANWLSDDRNPLTARVIVNRVWYWMMGRGIVATLDNFGSTGGAPSNAMLLDHLANQFIRDGWSIKRLVRRIARSRVYQLSSQASDRIPGEGLKRDPSNAYFWRMNRKRLRAEDIRDSILQVSGSLDNSFGGSTIKPGTSTEYGYHFDTSRRSVYLPVFRNTLPEILEVFDFADPNIQLGQRSTSTIAAQALWMMNHPMILEQSRNAARKLMDSTCGSDTERMELAYLQVLARPPSHAEREISLELLGSANADEERLEAWSMLYQTLFQCLDFRFLN